jgi:hypothetical protein
VTDFGIPRSDARVVVDVELYPGADDHTDHLVTPKTA